MRQLLIKPPNSKSETREYRDKISDAGLQQSCTFELAGSEHSQLKQACQREELRLQVLHSLNILETPPDNNIDLLCRMARDLFDVPVALISLVDRDRQWFKARYGLEASWTSREIAFCNYTIQSNEVCIVPDALEDMRFAKNPLVVGAPFIRFYAGAPLWVDGHAIGSLCVIDNKPRCLSSLQHSLLKDLASVVVTQLTLHKQKSVENALANERLEMLNKLRKQSKNLWHSAHYDSLTGIPNRAYFHERLRELLADAKGDGTSVALVILDLDNLKQVNDTGGHPAGDALLQAAAKTLKKNVRKSDFVARIGGDEFALILPGLTSTIQAFEILSSVQKRLVDLKVLGGVKAGSASAGISIFPGHALDEVELLMSADVALYAAKQTSRGSAVLFAPAMKQALNRKTEAEANIRAALASNKIFPFYQPKVSSSSGELLGLEALLRWEHPTKELQFPGAISELFDDADLGSVLGERMVDRVLDDMSNWTKNGVRFGRVFVNASAIELRNSGYAEAIIGRLAKAGVDPACFGIEVTETGFFNSKTEGLLHELKTLNAAGISIVLDDFGTGFGSLTHLLHFPISGIKIDCSFVSRMDTEPHARGVINAMIALAKNLGLDLVAEGIETRDQLTFFRNAGCPAIQGYLFSKPVPAENIPGLSKSLPVKFQKIMGSPEALQKKRRR